MTVKSTLPKSLKPYKFHGLRIDYEEGQSDTYVDCPFCDGQNKFSINVETGKWRCFVCNEGKENEKVIKGGNVYTFLRRLHQLSMETTKKHNLLELRDHRKLLKTSTLTRWGVCQSLITGDWLLPGYSIDGKLNQLYRYVYSTQDERWLLLATTTLDHCLIGVDRFDKKKGTVFLCYSSDTEILTETGWKLFKDLTSEDKVAAYGEDQSIKFEKPNARQRFSYSGNMVNLKSDWCDLLVTHDHRMLYKYRAMTCGKVKKASELGGQIQLPVSGLLSTGHYGPDELMARLLVAFVADGCDRGNQIEFRFRKDRKKTRLKELLVEAGIPYNVVVYPNSVDYESIMVKGNFRELFLEWCPDKTWQGSEVNWTLESRQAMLDELQYWDGDKGVNNIRYFTSKKEEAELISRIAVTSGFSSAVETKREGREFVVSISYKDWRTIAKPPVKQTYKGKVYCVTVSTGLIIVRRNGKAVVSGNCEGPWDAMAFEEVAGSSRYSSDSIVYSANPKETLAAYCNILAVPGAMTFFENWCPLFHDKIVNVCYDSDVPRVHKTTGRMIPSTGYEATKRVSIMLAQSESPPAEIHHLKWGENGFDPTLSSGYDVRDGLSDSKTTDGRIKLLSDLLKKIEPMPEEWLEGRSKEEIEKGGTQLELLPCHKWKDLLPVWRKAMKWTEGLDRALSVMLACVTSTKAVGDQLWVKIIGMPSSGKTSLVEAVAASKKYVLSKSTLRGFHSGFRTKDGSTDDNSLIAQLFNKTLVTKDGDSLLTSPNLPMILAEARDLYDGSASASYRTGQNNIYEGLRITWILCGTNSLRKLDRSELGERFLDCVVMEGIDDILEDEVLWIAVNKAHQDMNFESNGELTTQRNPKYVKAMQMTGGYVEYLRANARDLLKKVKFPEEMLRRCMILAKFVSYVRAKPPGKHAEKAEREFSPRLGKQLVRLAQCLAVVLNRKEVDEEVMSRTAKVACDTARGHSLEVIKRLYKGKPLNDRSLALSIGIGKQDMDNLLSFLCGIEVARRVENKGVIRYMLTDKMKRLFEVTRQLVQEYEGVLK